MTYQEYNDRRNDIVNAYNNGEMNLPDMKSKLADLNREYESSHPTSTFDNWKERAEEAPAKMKPSEIIIGTILAALAGIFLGAFITGLVTILTDV